MGYEISDENIVRIKEQGFEFLSKLKSPLYHWEDLSSKMSIQEKQDLHQISIFMNDQNILSSIESH